jgi:hypothetical protein
MHLDDRGYRVLHSQQVHCQGASRHSQHSDKTNVEFAVHQAGTLKTPALASMSDGDLSTVIDFGGCGVFKLDASGKLAVLYAFQDSP